MVEPKPTTIRAKRKHDVPIDHIDSEQLDTAENLVSHVRDWFVETRRDEATILHNEMVTVIQSRKPPVEVVMTVLEILKHEVMKGVIKKFEQQAAGETQWQLHGKP